MKNIFGDDGFRCKYGEKYLTKRFLIVFSIALAKYFKKKYKKPKCIIGIDTRITGPKIFEIISAELIDLNIEVHYCGVIPSPGISFILKKFDFHFGIMITASHNPSEDNGIKLFNNQGFKLNPAHEKVIERSIRRNLQKNVSLSKKKSTGKSEIIHNKIYIKSYMEFLKKIIDTNKIKKKIIIDCSNGASSYLISDLFKSIKNIIIVNNKPNGININHNCGSLHPNKLRKLLIKKNFDYGIALDGDSDRCILVDKKNGLIESEKVLFIILKIIKSGKKNKLVCSSEIVNKALESNLNKINYSLFQTKVGDRNVINYSKKKNAIVGFEPSGHFYYPKLNNSMDGNITIILILNFLIKYMSNFNKIKQLDNYNRIIKSIPFASIDVSLSTIKKRINKLQLYDNEKLLIRQSIWDPVYRVYYDYKKINRFEEIRKYLLN